MGIRFNKSIKIANGVKANISKSGVSLTIGKKGMTFNVGKNGLFTNLSLPGTGLSYRKQLVSTSGIIKKIKNKKDKKEDNKETNEKVINKKEQLPEESNELYLHNGLGQLLSITDFTSQINDENREEISKLIEGDEDTIEELVGQCMANLTFDHSVNCSYELEDDELFVDLDLPEIEEFESNDKKAYSDYVLSLPICLAFNFFNLSPYIAKVNISAYTSKRDSKGDLVDYYIYSVKYTRSVFENTDFENLGDPYQFMLKFENRIIFNNNTFKKIEPFELKSVEVSSSCLDEAIEALNALGYKNADINAIKPELQALNLSTTQEYLKEALKLLKR